MKNYFYECGICAALHPARFAGDCRDDDNRYFSDELDEWLGWDEWSEIDMQDADLYPAPVNLLSAETMRRRLGWK